MPTHDPLPGPHAPAAELANLSVSRSAPLRRAVAAHANAPAAVLGALAAEFPDVVLGNPALPLLRLAQPGLLRSWPLAGLLAVLRQPDVPAWVPRQLLAHPAVEVQVALAGCAGVDGGAVRTLAAHPAWLVRARVAGRPDVPADVLARLALDPDDSVRLAVACRPALDRRVRVALRGDPSRYVQRALRRAAVDT